jgi:hypothetical protein
MIEAEKALIEVKHTDRASLRIKRRWLKKIEQEAGEMGRMPVLAMSIGLVNQIRWYAFPEWCVTEREE